MFARDLARRLANFALTQGSKPRLHPNGFVQLDLIPNGDVRLHVWPDEPLQAQATRHPIHDHAFDMESVVLLGRMTNVLYTSFPVEQVAFAGLFPFYVLHSVHSLGHDTTETILKPVSGTQNLVALHERRRVEVEAGQTYCMPAAVLHDSQPHGLTTTIMTKARFQRGYRPLVAVPLGVHPDNEFRRATDETKLLQVINKALESISNIGGAQNECNHEKDVVGNCCFSRRVGNHEYALPSRPGCLC